MLQPEVPTVTAELVSVDGPGAGADSDVVGTSETGATAGTAEGVIEGATVGATVGTTEGTLVGGVETIGATVGGVETTGGRTGATTGVVTGDEDGASVPDVGAGADTGPCALT